jgi:hypothetical protein
LKTMPPGAHHASAATTLVVGKILASVLPLGAVMEVTDRLRHERVILSDGRLDARRGHKLVTRVSRRSRS